ncbi:hypothetical protein RhiirA1_460168 [Rhizophagus irregularis]|uniref:Uncharacterized protein n=1 Tax=Rhizophagus irregularis TaxID=588596 RepID=A0A2N0RS32_9GLOM|nr:hypothetical protein RhiirA1_460168 [Rhizophagus irregularis]
MPQQPRQRTRRLHHGFMGECKRVVRGEIRARNYQNEVRGISSTVDPWFVPMMMTCLLSFLVHGYEVRARDHALADFEAYVDQLIANRQSPIAPAYSYSEGMLGQLSTDTLTDPGIDPYVFYYCDDNNFGCLCGHVHNSVKLVHRCHRSLIWCAYNRYDGCNYLMRVLNWVQDHVAKFVNYYDNGMYKY